MIIKGFCYKCKENKVLVNGDLCYDCYIEIMEEAEKSYKVGKENEVF